MCLCILSISSKNLPSFNKSPTRKWPSLPSLLACLYGHATYHCVQSVLLRLQLQLLRPSRVWYSILSFFLPPCQSLALGPSFLTSSSPPPIIPLPLVLQTIDSAVYWKAPSVSWITARHIALCPLSLNSLTTRPPAASVSSSPLVRLFCLSLFLLTAPHGPPCRQIANRPSTPSLPPCFALFGAASASAPAPAYAAPSSFTVMLSL